MLRPIEDWTYQEHYDMEDRHWWFRSRRRVLWAFLHRANLGPSPRILDAGCGTGRNMVEFQALGPVEGVDLSPQAVSFCHGRGLTDVREAAVEALPYEDDRFDVVLATDVIEHLPEDGPALEEMRRVTAPQGRILITVPAYTWLWSRHDTSWHHYRRYTLRRLRARALATGWEPEVESYYYASLLPAVAAVRTVQRLRGEPEGEPQSDLHLSPAALDRVLEAPIHGEARLIERGVSLPAGVSVGMVCRRR
jgi:SAM-dependent methyltransferase